VPGQGSSRMASVLLMYSATAALFSVGTSCGAASHMHRLPQVRMSRAAARSQRKALAWTSQQRTDCHGAGVPPTHSTPHAGNVDGPVAIPLGWAIDEDSTLRFGSDTPKQPPMPRYASKSQPQKQGKAKKLTKGKKQGKGKKQSTSEYAQDAITSTAGSKNMLGWATDDDNVLRFGSDAPKHPPPPRYAKGHLRQMRVTSRPDPSVAPAMTSTNSLGWATDEKNVAVKQMISRHVNSASKPSTAERMSSAKQTVSASSLHWATGQAQVVSRSASSSKPQQNRAEQRLNTVDCTQAVRAAKRLLQSEASERAQVPPAEATICEPRAATRFSAQSGGDELEAACCEDAALGDTSMEAVDLIKKKYSAYLVASAARVKAEKALATAEQALAMAIKAEDRAGKNADEALRAIQFQLHQGGSAGTHGPM